METSPALFSPAGGAGLGGHALCANDHAAYRKVVGPSYKDLARKCPAKDETRWTDRLLQGGKGVWGLVALPANASVTPDERNRLVTWIRSRK